MSPPDSPTLVNRNRKLADSASSRMSDAAASTAPRRNAVHRGHHRLGHVPQIAGALAGHARELVHVPGVSGQQLADDLVHVTTRAEAAAAAPEHQHPDFVGALGELGDEIADVGVHLKRQRVEPVRPRERDGCDAVLLLVVEMVPRRHRATASQSISAIASGWSQANHTVSKDLLSDNDDIRAGYALAPPYPTVALSARGNDRHLSGRPPGRPGRTKDSASTDPGHRPTTSGWPVRWSAVIVSEVCSRNTAGAARGGDSGGVNPTG